MNIKKQVDTLWQQMRDGISTTYNKGRGDADSECLRDYAEDTTMFDALSALLGRESAEERRHRSGYPGVLGFSNETAAKVLLMNFLAAGAEGASMPKATQFLCFRKTAVEAEVIGWLCRSNLSPEWLQAVKSLRYDELMKGGRTDAQRMG